MKFLFQLLKLKAFEITADMVKFSLETDYFPNYIPNNVFAYKTDNQFIDIGTPESLSDAQHMFSSSVGSE